MFPRRAAVVALACALFSSAPALAGDLAPPAGAVQPTDRVRLLDQSITLPYTITEPGSYVLISNLVAPPGADGIVIDADGVTIDLNGFSLVGSGTGRGIAPPVPTADVVYAVTVHNGHLSNWGSGVFGRVLASGFEASIKGQFHGLVFTECDWGIQLLQESTVARCSAIACQTGFGLQTSHMRDCHATMSDFNGFSVSHSNMVDCVATWNSQGVTLFDAHMTGCTVKYSTQNGITASQVSSVRRCAISNNGSDGIASIGSGLIVEECVIEGNQGYGIRFPNAPSVSLAYKNILWFNALGPVLVGGADAPISATGAGAGAWDNIAP